MKRIILVIISVLMLASVSACKVADTDKEKIIVAVGIVPEATFVQKVAGDIVEVVTLIPPGNSPANYQPTAGEMQALSDAKIYFTLQMPTEEANILPKVSDFNEDIKIINLRNVVSEVYPLLTMEHNHDEDHGEEHEQDHDGDEQDHDGDEHDEHEQDHDSEEHEQESVDPHLWLSPKRAIVMVQSIADELSAIDEDNKQLYQDNAKSYIAEIKKLDTEIQQEAASIDNKSFLIYHGAYGYFADDYDFEMNVIEIQGKQATAVEIQEVVEHTMKNEITTVFYQEEFDDSQAQTIAEEIGGRVEKVSPLSPNYIQGIRDFIDALTQ